LKGVRLNMRSYPLERPRLAQARGKSTPKKTIARL